MNLREYAEDVLSKHHADVRQQQEQARRSNATQAQQHIRSLLELYRDDEVQTVFAPATPTSAAGSIIKIDLDGDPVYLRILRNIDDRTRNPVMAWVVPQNGTYLWAGYRSGHADLGPRWHWQALHHTFSDRVGFARSALGLRYAQEEGVWSPGAASTNTPLIPAALCSCHICRTMKEAA